MKPDYELAITLTKVNGFVTLVTQAIEEHQYLFALELLQTELSAYQHALALLPLIESKTFVDFFTPWLPARIENTKEAISKVECLLHD